MHSTVFDSPLFFALCVAVSMASFGAICALAGVGLGAWIVFRSTRESHDSLFGGDEDTGDIVQLTGDQDPFAPNPVPRTVRPFEPSEDDELPDETAIMGHNARFLHQIGAESARDKL